MMNRQVEAVQASINGGQGDPATLIVTLGLHCDGVADPNIETHGPILLIFSKPLTNSPIILNMAHESLVFISFHPFGFNLDIVFFF